MFARPAADPPAQRRRARRAGVVLLRRPAPRRRAGRAAAGPHRPTGDRQRAWSTASWRRLQMLSLGHADHVSRGGLPHVGCRSTSTRKPFTRCSAGCRHDRHDLALRPATRLDQAPRRLDAASSPRRKRCSAGWWRSSPSTHGRPPRSTWGCRGGPTTVGCRVRLPTPCGSPTRWSSPRLPGSRCGGHGGGGRRRPARVRRRSRIRALITAFAPRRTRRPTPDARDAATTLVPCRAPPRSSRSSRPSRPPAAASPTADVFFLELRDRGGAERHGPEGAMLFGRVLNWGAPPSLPRACRPMSRRRSAGARDGTAPRRGGQVTGKTGVVRRPPAESLVAPRPTPGPTRCSSPRAGWSWAGQRTARLVRAGSTASGGLFGLPDATNRLRTRRARVDVRRARVAPPERPSRSSVNITAGMLYCCGPGSNGRSQAGPARPPTSGAGARVAALARQHFHPGHRIPKTLRATAPLQVGDAYFCGPGCLAGWQARGRWRAAAR